MLIEVVAITIGGLVLIVYIIARSKCIRFKGFCIEVERDVALEEKEHEFNVKHNVREIPKISELL